MPSAVKKGNLFEGEVRKILAAAGWTVEGQHRKAAYIPFKSKVPFGKPQLRLVMIGRDIFGCDVIAKKAGEKTLFVQVSTRENKVHKIKQVMAYPWNFEHDEVQLWLRADGKREYEVFAAPDFVPRGDVRACVAKKVPSAL